MLNSEDRNFGKRKKRVNRATSECGADQGGREVKGKQSGASTWEKPDTSQGNPTATIRASFGSS